MKSNARRILVTATLVSLASLSAGCELLLDFDRSLIDAGVDSAFVDAGDSGSPAPDATTDALTVPDADKDVKFIAPDTGRDSPADSPTDTTMHEASTEASTGDSGHKEAASPQDAEKEAALKEAATTDAPMGDASTDAPPG